MGKISEQHYDPTQQDILYQWKHWTKTVQRNEKFSDYKSPFLELMKPTSRCEKNVSNELQQQSTESFWIPRMHRQYTLRHNTLVPTARN